MTQGTRPRLAIVMITKNEAGALPRCLETVRWADELVVVDSGSEDRTLEIAREFGARTQVRPFTDFADQRNFALSLASAEWVLSLDPDEEVGPELRDEILAALPAGGRSGYWIPTSYFMMGRWIRHGGWSPNWHLRLFRREGARWVGAVHEKVVVPGPIGRLRSPIIHGPGTEMTFSERIRRLDRYTDMEAASASSPWRGGWLTRPATSRLMLWVQLALLPPAMFLYKYVWQQGFRDGLPGLVIAGLLSFYHFARAAKVLERKS